MKPNPLCQVMPESWYRINIWHTIDIAFADIPYLFFIGQVKQLITVSYLNLMFTIVLYLK